MTSIIKRRLDDALQVGHKIDKEQRSEQLSINSADASLHVTNQKDIKVGDENGIFSIALNHNGSKAAVGLGSGVLQFYECEQWERLRKIRTDLITSLPLLAVKFYPCLTDNALFTGGSDGLIKSWNLDTFSSVESVEEHGNQITTLDFNSTGKNFATGGKDCCLRVYDSGRMKLLKMYKSTDLMDIDSSEDVRFVPGHSKKVFVVKFHPDDNNIFFSAGWDHTLKIWDTRADSAVRTIYGPFVCGDGLDVRHKSILTASWQAQDALQLWDFSSGSLIETIPFPVSDRKGEYLYCARFYDDTNIVAGGSGTNDIKMINLRSKKVEFTVDGSLHTMQAVEVMAAKKMLTCGTSGSMLKSLILSE